MEEKILIIIPTLNEENYIRKLLERLAKQTYTNFEVIVVDGHSKDKTNNIVTQFKDIIDIKLIKSKKRNVSYQRNIGAKKAKEDLLLFLDADVTFKKDFLKEGIKYMKKKNINAGFPKLKPNTNQVPERIFFHFLNQAFKIAQYIKPSGLSTALFIEKGEFNTIGGFDENLTYAEDLDLISRLKGKFRVLPLYVNFSTRRFEKFGTRPMIALWLKTFFLYMSGSERYKELGKKYFSKKITLILPKYKEGMYGFPAPPTPILYLATLTKPKYNVEIIDERIMNNKYRPTDLVCISVKTCTANRAYEIADIYRKKGTKVVLGGIHPSALPEESLRYADSVVIGEAEDTWEELLKDFEHGELKKKYYSNTKPDISKIPPIDYTLIKSRKYLIKNAVQTSRGCPYGCAFCSPTHLYGKKLRHRDIDNVIDEIKSIKKNSRGLFKNIIYFTDDNIIADKSYATKLFERMKELDIKWTSQCNIDIANDDHLLKLAYESGCRLLWIGFESTNPNVLKEAKKSYDPRRYPPLIKKIRRQGIAILGSFVFGLDNGKEEDVSDIYNFATGNRLDLANFLPLMPRPGTPLFDKMEKERRILHKNWDLYEGFNIVYTPKNVSPKKLRNEVTWINKTFYSYNKILKRFIRNIPRFSLKMSLYLLIMNICYKKNTIDRINYIKNESKS